MLQMTFGIDERDVRVVLQKHWDVVNNPQHVSIEQLTLSIWHSFDEIDRDRFATAGMEAYLDGLDEVEGGRQELRKYLIEQRLLNCAPRQQAARNQIDLLHTRGRLPERRHTARHR